MAEPAPPEIVLDLSRLVSRVRKWTPTGVDRVEMAYAEHLLDLAPERLSFGAFHPGGSYGRLPTDIVRRFLSETREAWDGTGTRPGRRSWPELARALWDLRPRPIPPASRPRVIIHSSPSNLHRQDRMEGILRREGARLVCLLHDLIPIEYPEYARPGGAATHLRRVRTVARLADGIIANSEATRQSFLPYLQAEGRDTPIRVAHLGIDAAPAITLRDDAASAPYFVCVGTIEPRKNHLLLLNLWRAMAQERPGAAPPRLEIIGRRGWENEQIIDMLDRCPALIDCVAEHNRLSDRQMRAMIAGARALLMPSFAEGYGMPVAEALSMGVPVICSDLPALREAGGNVPDFIDPLDGASWMATIREYAQPGSVKRSAQLSRLAHWRPAGWRDHVRAVLEEADRVGA